MLPTHPSAPMNRERRQWTPQEDELLRMAVSREEPGNPAPSKWHAIAQHVPNRTNKDCRKRWYAKMSSDVVKGGWAPDEDQRLLNAIDCYGTRWSLVASMVQTRNSDRRFFLSFSTVPDLLHLECAKRWCDTLNPAIDRTAWSAEADDILIKAVNEHGKVWTKIVGLYFPGRTGLAAKNRYNSITRSEESTRSSSRRRHSPDSSPSPSLETDPHYSNQYSRSSMSQPGYPGIPPASQQSGNHTRHYSMSQSASPSSGFSAPSRHRSTMSQFQPPVDPGYSMGNTALSQPSAYYSTGSTRYPATQYQGQPAATFPSNNAAFPDYSSSLGQGPYSQAQQQQMQYPDTTYTAGYTTTSSYPRAPNQSSSSGLPRTTSDPRNWGPF
ncbi:hypothetical protein B0H16DRAFT_1521530 [Mycena metata]|uniref:Uncharacterized protein n=1 Tax=Mycena metata TaxID=1033252 RepID=A0AAD7NMW8_9AGAR|nr:hypothetical protein B0H16DRAFT_1521530 [Mycena metata]